MKLTALVNEILDDVAFMRDSKPYKNVYFIKPINPGDRKSLFVSFRYKTSKNEVIIAWTEINLENTNKNVTVGLSYLWPQKRESITFFKKRLLINHKSIIEILHQTVAPLIIEKLQKVEDSYVNNNSNH